VVAGGRVGVLGGIGPEASSEYYRKLIDALQRRNIVRTNTDFPQIILNSIPAPELVGEITEQELAHYRQGLAELDSLGVDFIIMVCNTIHLHLDALQRAVRAPILDLREEVRRTLAARDVSCALVIGTPNTILQGLYRYDDLRILEPTLEEMSELSDAIVNFNIGKDKHKQANIARRICQQYLDRAHIIILGCTEFGVMLGNSDLPTLNTIDVMVEATLRHLTTPERVQNQRTRR
jgi:aspartate racemase